MFVLYLLAEDSREFAILAQPQRIRFATMYNNESRCPPPWGRTTNVAAIIYDFKAIREALRKQRIDDWWQPEKPEPKADQRIANDDFCDPFSRFNWEG
jgi:hypothetical protein